MTARNASAPTARDEHERDELLAALSALLDRDMERVRDGAVSVDVPLAVYVDHLSNGALRALVTDARVAAGIMLRAKARLSGSEFLLWRMSNLPKEVGDIGERGADIGLGWDGVERSLDDLPPEPQEKLPPLLAAAGAFDAESNDELKHGVLEGGPLLGVAPLHHDFSALSLSYRLTIGEEPAPSTKIPPGEIA